MRCLVLGGTGFFGIELVKNLLAQRFDVTLATRGKAKDPFGGRTTPLLLDRQDATSLRDALAGKTFDVVYDQIGYSSQNAKELHDALGKRTGHLIFTSSLSVYEEAGALTEEDFAPATYPLKIGAYQKDFDYREGKRQAEAYYVQTAPWPVTCVRMPLVLGPGDTSGRFRWHIDRVRNKEPIYFPNLEAKIAMIHASEAGSFLASLAESPQGPINVASSEPVVLGDMVRIMEKVIGHQATLASEESEKDWSPYGVKTDYFMNIEKARRTGFQPLDPLVWLEELAQLEGV